MPPQAKETIATTLDEEGWAKISGEAAEKDFLQVVEVFSKWCGPSEAIITTLQRIQRDLPGRRVKFWQIESADAIPDLAKYTAFSRPHFLFYKNGEHVDTVEGINAPLIEKFIADFIPEGIIETDEAGEGEEGEDD